MSLRNEQCNKVCKILDDVLAKRPTERDALIVAVRKAFDALDAKPQWIPVTERLPEDGGYYIVTENISEDGDKRVGFTWYSFHGWEWGTKPIAWMPLPEPWKEGENDV